MVKGAKSKERKRVVVEEVSPAGEITKDAASDQVAAPVEEIKEKVEELQTLTEGISESAEKQSEVQEEIAEAAEKVESAPETKPTDVKDFAPLGSQKRGLNSFVILIPGILLLGVLLGGIYFYQKNINPPSEATPLSTLGPAESPSPSASPSATLNLSKYQIKIENGSGIPGTAGSVKSLLVKAGFKVGSTGNADNYDYTNTIIKVKSDVPQEFISKLTEVLSGSYKVGDSKTLPDSSKDKVVVIVGSSKAQ